MKLRPYQSKLVCEALQALQTHDRVLVQAATGAGKTVVAAAIAHQFTTRVLFVSDRDNHVENWAKAVKAFPCTSEALTVQKCSRRSIAPPGLIVVDEAHHSKAATYLALLERFPNAKVIGLTATPQRPDGKPLSDVYQVMVQGPKVSKLIRCRHLARPRFFGLPQAKRVNLARIHVVRGDFSASEVAKASKMLCGSIVKEWLKRAAGLPTIAFAANVEHAERIVRAFKTRKIRVMLVAGNACGDKERQKARAGLISGKIDVVVSVGMYGEGWDCPEARCAILARPTLSLVLHLQQCGRVMRPGVTPIIIDHVGNLERLGYPDLDREWSLDDGCQREWNGDGGGSFGREKTCPTCGNTCPLAASKCMGCGYRFSQRQMIEVQAELEELRRQKLGTCIDCGKPLGKYSRRKGIDQCRPCRQKSPALCLDCEKPLANKNAKRCKGCNGLAHRSPPVVCLDCEKPLGSYARGRGTVRCKPCWLAARRKPAVA